MKPLTVAIISFITMAITLQACLKNGFIDLNFNDSKNFKKSVELVVLKTNRYKCTYAGLWCACYTNNRGGCSVGCCPNTYKILYNQSECFPLDNFVLSGFNLE